ncbi:LysM peptidoglycan-binding domain-containing protein [Bacillus sp. M6-12]|uniref:LysM peptidoglycan-binding domain-containing protein n=1 Tax=Bacillus sp. M6-12 TaxID=2054166 RepID=UPI0015E0B855|nr:transglycosylase SLT domain-containing protein [Bacillus sp. M6-12]
MRNSHLYQYLKGLRKAQGSQKDNVTVTTANVKNRKEKGQKVLLTAMSLMLSAGIFLPFGEQVAEASSLTHVIQKGDTLYKVANEYHVSVDKLKQANKLSSNTIYVGKKLVIPGQTAPVQTTAPKKVTSPSTSKSIYNPKVPMKKEQQEYLYKLTQQRGLDYKKTLALIKTESTFNPNALGGSNYGLMQINKVNHASLAKTLKTANKPYDPYINMNWGTYMLSDLYKYWKGRGLTGTKLDQYVWSSYNRGLGGAKKYGIKTSYVNKMNANVKYINNLF